MFKERIKIISKKTSLYLFLACFSTSLLNSCVVNNEQPLLVSSTPFIEERPSIDVCFSPEGNCQPIILKLINNAKTKILVQSYSFTSKNIANALIKVHQRGVKVKLLFDRSQLTARHSQIHKMKGNGIECIVDSVPGISHNKVIIIDKDIVLTGSYNWTNAAESRNAENLLIIKNRPTAQIYTSNWKKRYQRAKNISFQGFTNKRLLPKARATKMISQ